MRLLDGFFHNTFALADLKAGSVVVAPWPEALSQKAREIVPGGAAAAAVLSTIYEDSLVLASGPFTGAMIPGSALLMSAVPGESGKPVHIPFLLRHGANLKASGVDFAVVAGAAREPSVLILAAGGKCRIEPAKKLASLDVPGLRKAFAARLNGSDHSLILCGPAARAGAACASAGVEAGMSLDRGAVASWMARHNLVAVVLAGGGPLPAARPGGISFEKVGQDSGLEGFLDVLDRVEGGPEAKPLAVKLLGRSAACHLCPRPCLAYLKPGPASTGTLCTDHAGFAALGAACPQSVPRALEACARLGLDPAAAAPALKGLAPEAVGNTLEALASGAVESPPVSSGATPPLPPWMSEDSATHLHAGLVLGICPILLQRRSDIPLEEWLTGLFEEKDLAELKQRLNGSSAVIGPASGPESTAN